MMDVLIEKKMIEIKSEPVEVVMMDNHKSRRRSSSTSSQPTELEPCEEFPILYGLLTAPKSFKPRNSEELGLLPLSSEGSPDELENKEGNGGLVITSRVQLVDCRRRRSRHPSDSMDDDDDEADSQNLDFSSRDSSRSSSSNRSPQLVDSSSNLSAPDRAQDENNSPTFMHYLNGHEDDSANSPASSGSSSVGDDSIDDNIPTSTTSGFKRKASRLETAIGNIVKRKGKVVKRSSNNNNNTVPISLAPSSPTVSTTCVDPPPPAPRGRSEILERILRSTTTNTVNPEVSRNHSPVRRNTNDSNNNESGQEEPYAKLRDLLTMSEDQLVKRRRLEYGLSENKVHNQQQHRHLSPEPVRRREMSPPRNNILASLLQKGRAPYDPTTYHYQSGNGRQHQPHGQALVSINKLSDNSGSINSSSGNDDRPYKCSLCDLRFKKLPLLNRHVKTHSHIKRYVCTFCSHAFKRSDNLLAHMRTSCKGIKESDAKFAGGAVRPGRSNKIVGGGQIIPQLLSSPPTGLVSPTVSRSQLEEALLNLRHEQVHHHVEEPHSSPSPSLVSTTTASPPPPSAFRRAVPAPLDFQSRHSKLLEILSGSPVIAHNHHQYRREVEEDDKEEEMPLPLSLKVERRSSSPSSSPSSSSSNQSQYRRSHNQRILYSMMQDRNELPREEREDEEFDEEEENDNVEPLNLGRNAVLSPPPQQMSRDHPEIVSILSRQPKNVVMMGPDLRKLVGIDA